MHALAAVTLPSPIIRVGTVAAALGVLIVAVYLQRQAGAAMPLADGMGYSEAL